jgi:hypothetical protein
MLLRDHVSRGSKVRFSHYCNKELWYRTDSGLDFPVPIEDCGNATFLAEDKAIFFMRYIRRHMEMLSEALVEDNSTTV